MVRDSLGAKARHLSLLLTPEHGAILHLRRTPGEATEFQELISHAALKLPIQLRLTRRGNAITAEYSTDGGRTFRPAAEPWRPTAPLPGTPFLGLAMASHHPTRIAEARFDSLEVRQP
jgi:hypothetical protein